MTFHSSVIFLFLLICELCFDNLISKLKVQTAEKRRQLLLAISWGKERNSRRTRNRIFFRRPSESNHCSRFFFRSVALNRDHVVFVWDGSLALSLWNPSLFCCCCCQVYTHAKEVTTTTKRITGSIWIFSSSRSPTFSLDFEKLPGGIVVRTGCAP